MAETLFSAVVDQTIDPDKDYFSELVGEGKKYKDPQAAGRALVEKDAFIETLKSEAAAARDELKTREGLAAFIDRMEGERNKAAPQANNQKPNEGSPQPQPNSQPQNVDVESLVQKAISARLQQTEQEQNFTKVEQVLKQNFGPGYASVLAQKAQELGLGTEFLDDLAKKSPKAFFAAVGVSETPQRAPNQAQSLRANPGTSAGSGKKNFAYYETLRKTDPDKYQTAEVQKEIFRAAKDADERGEDFYA